MKISSEALNVYWNNGKASITEFLDEHLPVCKGKNWICDGLGLLNPPVFEEKKTSKRKKPTMSFLVDNSVINISD